MIEPRTDSDRIRSIETDLFAVRHELASLRRKTPGFFSNVLSGTLSVTAGLILYSIVGVVITMLAWSAIVAAIAEAAAVDGRRQMEQRVSEPQAPVGTNDAAAN
ncbi:MAG: hypothetical protein WAZ94_13270 [Phycisphaerales bacterium]